MKIQTVLTSKIKTNAHNPRLIKNIKFKKLVASIESLPSMLHLRPIVVDKNMTILGGNMRYKACIEAGLKEIPIIIADELTAQEQQEFIIKDNVSYGEWDWNILGNDYDFVELDSWGMDLPADMFNDTDNEINTAAKDAKTVLEIPFEAEHYEEAKKLYNFFVDKGAYVGAMLIEYFKEQKNKTNETQ